MKLLTPHPPFADKLPLDPRKNYVEEEEEKHIILAEVPGVARGIFRNTSLCYPLGTPTDSHNKFQSIRYSRLATYI